MRIETLLMTLWSSVKPDFAEGNEKLAEESRSILKATLGEQHLHFTPELKPCRQLGSVTMPTTLLSSSSHWFPPLPATRKLPTGERHIYISLTLPRLSDSSLLLAPAGPFQWTVFRMEGGRWGGVRDGMLEWTGHLRIIPSPTDDLFDQNVTRELALNFKPLCIKKKTMSMFDHVHVWSTAFLASQYVHKNSTSSCTLFRVSQFKATTVRHLHVE